MSFLLSGAKRVKITPPPGRPRLPATPEPAFRRRGLEAISACRLRGASPWERVQRPRPASEGESTLRGQVESGRREAGITCLPSPTSPARSRRGHSGAAAAARRLSYSASCWTRRRRLRQGAARPDAPGRSFSECGRPPRAGSSLCGVSRGRQRGSRGSETASCRTLSSTDNRLVAPACTPIH